MKSPLLIVTGIFYIWIMVSITEYVSGEYKANDWIINPSIHVKWVNGDRVGIYDNGLNHYIIPPTIFSEWTDPSNTPYASLQDLINDLNAFFFDLDPVSLYTEVNTFADLPDPALNSGVTYHVLNATGLWILGTRRQSGLYRSNGTAWILRNDISSLLVDSEFNIRDDADNTKGMRFVLDGLTTGLLRAYTWPDKDGTVAMLDDTGIQSIQEGTRIDVDATDPINPIVSVDPATDAQINSNSAGVVQNASDIAQEVIDRGNADTALQANIDAEALTRQTVDEGTVTVHNDVSDAGSGEIITPQERTDINASIDVHSDVDLSGVTPNIDNYVLRWDFAQLEFIPCLYQVVRSSALVINNTNVLQQIINQDINIQRLVPHKITVSYSWSLNDGGQDFIAVASLGGLNLMTALTDNTEIHRQEPKDVGGGDPDGRGTNQRQRFTGVFFVTPVSLGNNALILSIAGSANGDLASIWETCIEVEELVSVIGS